jgi:hypothetical protein
VVLVLRHGMRVHFWHHQRDVFLVAELRGVVDDDTAGFACFRGVNGRHAGTRREQTDLRLGKVKICKIFNSILFVVEAHCLAGATFAGQQIQVVYRKLALFKDAQHGLADRTRGSDDGDVLGLVVAHKTRSCCRPVFTTDKSYLIQNVGIQSSTKKLSG